MEDDENEFKWGVKEVVGQENSDVQYYNSLTYKGMLYSLYDCVYTFFPGAVETDIGKLVKMYETPNHERKVEIVWFFRPIHLRMFLSGLEVKWNELFLASGQGTGLTNTIDVSTIVGKCNVVCISKDKRNTQVSEIKLKKAAYVFYRTFDVGRQVMSEKFPDEIAGIKVEFLLNGLKGQTITHPALQKQGELNNMSVILKPYKDTGSPAKSRMPASKKIGAESEHLNSSENAKVKRLLVPSKTQPGREIKDMSKVRFSEVSVTENTAVALPLKKRPKLLDSNGSIFKKEGPSEWNYAVEKAIVTAQNARPILASDRGLKIHGNFVEVTRRPDADRKNWFKQLPWEERLLNAQKAGTLVLFENLDPSYTSSEVEDLVWHALKEKVQARMIEYTTYSSPLYGKAYVIFKSQVAADNAINELGKRFLILGDGRSVCARRRNLRVPSTETSFHGHLVLEQQHKHQSHEMRNAVSTAHCSQNNTMEYDLALQWLELQQKFDLQWNTLYKEHMKDINEVKSKLKKINQNGQLSRM